MGDGKIREVGEVGVQALAVCVSECNCVCIQGVYMCGRVHNACVTGLCRWLLCVCMRVYIVQGWDMEAQDLGVCLSGLLSAWTCACGLCSVHVTACSTINRISCVSATLPRFLCVSALFFSLWH